MEKFEKIIKGVKSLTLSSEEKQKIISRVSSHIGENPVIETTESRQIQYSGWGSQLAKLLIGLRQNKLFMPALIIAFMLVFGGGVTLASNVAGPGDFLFPVDLAIEKMQIKLAGETRKPELKLRFAEERVGEIKRVSEEKTFPAALVADLSAANVTEIEADVFTNETLVKIEASDKKYGYQSALKTKAELAAEISTKYSISEEKVNALLNFEIENRESRPEDMGFLNKTHAIVFSEREGKDIGTALTDLEKLLSDESSPRAEELKKSLEEILMLLGDEAELEIKKKDGKIKIEGKDGKVEIKFEAKENNSGPGRSDDNDDESDDRSGSSDNDSNDDDDDKSLSVDLNISIGDEKEDDSEVFCRGEWRDPEDCDDNDDNSGKNDDDSSDDD